MNGNKFFSGVMSFSLGTGLMVAGTHADDAHPHPDEKPTTSLFAQMKNGYGATASSAAFQVHNWPLSSTYKTSYHPYTALNFERHLVIKIEGGVFHFIIES